MIRLQSFSHLVSRYERPNQPWICGRVALGQPCRIGPDRGGHCQATFECRPQRKGDRWECTRPPSAGGKCVEGPHADGTCACAIPPCVPVRSQRSRRGQIARLAAATLLGLLAVFLGGDRAAKWLVEPGHLTAQHAGIQDCATCHTGFAAGPVAWLHAAVGDQTPAAAAKPCLACHDIGSHPLAAHGLSVATLTRLRADVVSGKGALPVVPTGAAGAAEPGAAAVPPLPTVAKEPLACANCHREHKGIDASLTVIGNAACQTCHVKTFASLADGHPPFNGFPFHRRERIIFDHAAHYNHDFGMADKSLVPTDCTGCHAMGPAGRAMVVKPFETACGACHTDQIRGKDAVGDKGIAVIGVPAFDLATLRKDGAAIGEWPDDAENPMTPFLRFLLSTRDDTAKDLATLGTVELGDLSDAKPDQVKAAEHIAWAIKGLLYDLSVKGPAAFAAAATGSDEPAVLAEAPAALVAGLPPDAIRTAEKDWFPHLADEVTRHREGKAVPMKGAKPAPKANGRASAAPAPKSESHASILGGGGGGGILGGGSAAPAPKAEDHGSILGGGRGGGSILGGGGGILGGGSAAPTPKAENQGSILGGGGILGGAAAPAPAPAAAPPAPAKPEPPKPVDGEQWAALGGGWYRLYYTLYYRPAGHADPFLRAWLDVSGSKARDDNGPAAKLFAALTDPAAPGVCAKCHSVDRAADGARVVQWFPRWPNREEHGFTTFAHVPHLNLFAMQGCKTCHQIDQQGDFAATYKKGDPNVFAASFKPIKRELCADCHVAGKAPDSCVTCHNYHIGRIPQAPGVPTMDTQHPMPQIPEPDEAAAPAPGKRADAGAGAWIASVRLADRAPAPVAR